MANPGPGRARASAQGRELEVGAQSSYGAIRAGAVRSSSTNDSTIAQGDRGGDCRLERNLRLEIKLMAETNKVEPTITSMGAAPATAPMPDSPAGRGLRFYARGGLVFFKKMWPALYDLSTTETYVNASAIAFNVLLSFFSFVVLLGAFLNNVLNWKRGYETLFTLMRSMVPQESGELFRSLDLVTRGPGGKATLFSFALLIYGASGIFQPLEAALNRAWGFKERGVVKQYATYLSLAVGCAVIMLAPVALGTLYNIVLDT